MHAFARRLVVLVALTLILPASAHAVPLYFTTGNEASNDLFSVQPDGASRARLTTTQENQDLDEKFPTARGRTVLFQTRVTSGTIASIPGITYIAVGSDYGIVQRSLVRGRVRYSLPFARFTSSRLPLTRRFQDLSAPAYAPTGPARVAMNCRTPSFMSGANATQELCLAVPGARNLQVLTRCDCVDGGGTPVRLSWSRNGRYIAFVTGQKFYRFDVVRKRLVTVYDAARASGDDATEWFSHATISPDGSTIAARYDFSGGSYERGLRLVNVTTGATSKITLPERLSIVVNVLDAPSFSPDGTRLAAIIGYSANDDWVTDQPPGVYTMALDGTDLRLVTSGVSQDFGTVADDHSLTWGS